MKLHFKKPEAFDVVCGDEEVLSIFFGYTSDLDVFAEAADGNTYEVCEECMSEVGLMLLKERV